jgi:hypothetical protein
MSEATIFFFNITPLFFHSGLWYIQNQQMHWNIYMVIQLYDDKRQRLTFEEMVEQWIGYCRENETKTIPKAEGKLSRWVHNQKKAWKKLLTKQKTTMTTERVRVLSDAGFLFDPTTTTARDEISTSKKVTANNQKTSAPMPTPTSAKGKGKALTGKGYHSSLD